MKNSDLKKTEFKLRTQVIIPQTSGIAGLYGEAAYPAS
jgi:hypothetical protein